MKTNMMGLHLWHLSLCLVTHWEYPCISKRVVSTVIGKLASLFKVLDTFGDLKINAILVSKMVEGTFHDELLWKINEFDADIFWSVKVCLG